MNVVSFFAGCGGLELGFETLGDLPGLVRLDNIRHTHFSRNPKIAQYLKAFRLTELAKEWKKMHL